MSLAVSCLVAFAATAATDLVMALWVAEVGKGRRYRAALLSMMCATCLLVGIERIMSNALVVKGFWVLGYGVGTFLAVTLGKKGKGTT